MVRIKTCRLIRNPQLGDPVAWLNLTLGDGRELDDGVGDRFILFLTPGTGFHGAKTGFHDLIRPDSVVSRLNPPLNSLSLAKSKR